MQVINMNIFFHLPLKMLPESIYSIIFSIMYRIIYFIFFFFCLFFRSNIFTWSHQMMVIGSSFIGFCALIVMFEQHDTLLLGDIIDYRAHASNIETHRMNAVYFLGRKGKQNNFQEDYSTRSQNTYFKKYDLSHLSERDKRQKKTRDKHSTINIFFYIQ